MWLHSFRACSQSESQTTAHEKQWWWSRWCRCDGLTAAKSQEKWKHTEHRNQEDGWLRAAVLKAKKRRTEEGVRHRSLQRLCSSQRWTLSLQKRFWQVWNGWHTDELKAVDTHMSAKRSVFCLRMRVQCFALSFSSITEFSVFWWLCTRFGKLKSWNDSVRVSLWLWGLQTQRIYFLSVFHWVYI